MSKKINANLYPNFPAAAAAYRGSDDWARTRKTCPASCRDPRTGEPVAAYFDGALGEWLWRPVDHTAVKHYREN